MWRMQRHLSREEIKFNKMTEKYGPVHTFLTHFEEVAQYQEERYLQDLLCGFVAAVPSLMREFDNIKTNDIDVLISYCEKYDCNAGIIRKYGSE